jgi:hypothetical protein
LDREALEILRAKIMAILIDELPIKEKVLNTKTASQKKSNQTKPQIDKMSNFNLEKCPSMDVVHLYILKIHERSN